MFHKVLFIIKSLALLKAQVSFSLDNIVSVYKMYSYIAGFYISILLRQSRISLHIPTCKIAYEYLESTVYRGYPYKRPGGDAFFKKGVGWGWALLLQIKKNKLSSPVAMGDNGHL